VCSQIPYPKKIPVGSAFTSVNSLARSGDGSTSSYECQWQLRSAPTGDMTATYLLAPDPRQGSTGFQIDFEHGDRRRVLKMRLEPAPVAWFSRNWATSAGFGSILRALFDVACSKCVPRDLHGSACTKSGGEAIPTASDSRPEKPISGLVRSILVRVSGRASDQDGPKPRRPSKRRSINQGTPRSIMHSHKYPPIRNY
jgi:hypothetical protein